MALLPFATIRRLDASDAATFRDLRLRALREDPVPFLASYEDEAALTVDDFAARLGSSDAATAVLGAFLEDKLVGTLGFYRHRASKAKHRVSLWGMYVTPEERGRRLGGALLSEAIEQLRSVGDVEQIELSVMKDAPAARRLYLEAGFEIQGRLNRATKAAGAHFDEESLVMWLEPGQPANELGTPSDPGRRAPAPLRPRDGWIVESLATRSPSECLPVLLEVAARHATRRRPADLNAQLERDGFVAPSMLDLRLVHRLDGLALEAASEFDGVLLSPVAPLGTCAAVAPSSQNRILSTARATEVVSDPTNVLALECARRLRCEAVKSVRLCTVHQTMRAQRFPSRPGYSQHFRLFALGEAGAALADHAFEVEAFVRHARLFWRLLDACEAVGARFPNRRSSLLAAPRGRPIAARIRKRLGEALPGLQVEEGALDSDYYDGVRLLFGADGASGEHVNIADTGRFDWVAKLSSDRRHRYVASGLGLQLLPLAFGGWEAGAPVNP